MTEPNTDTGSAPATPVATPVASPPPAAPVARQDAGLSAPSRAVESNVNGDDLKALDAPAVAARDEAVDARASAYEDADEAEAAQKYRDKFVDPEDGEPAVTVESNEETA